MKRWRRPFIAAVLLLLFAAFGRSGGADPDPTEPAFKSRTEVRQQGAVTVRAAVLTDDESERYFGASLADQGIQAVWLSLDNASDLRLRFRLSQIRTISRLPKSNGCFGFGGAQPQANWKASVRCISG